MNPISLASGAINRFTRAVVTAPQIGGDIPGTSSSWRITQAGLA